jgi:hypothetical protein
MSLHPVSCPSCGGDGYVDGPPLYQTVYGKQHTYTTVTPCPRKFWNDEPPIHLDERRNR